MSQFSRKIDDVGRIALPRDVRRGLRWMGGDEIQITVNPDNTLTLSKSEKNYMNEFTNLYDDFCAERAAAGDPVTPQDNEIYNKMLAIFCNS